MDYTSNYLFDADNIFMLTQTSKDMENALKTAFDEAKALLDLMQGTGLWIGQLKNEFTAYLHLLVQYHGWLAGETIPSMGTVSTVQPEADCCSEMNKAWSDMMTNMLKFTANSDAYQQLEDIS